MLDVQVKFYGIVKGLIEEPEVRLPLPREGSARDVIKGLVARYGAPLAERILDAQGELYPNVKLFINNKEIQDLETKLLAPDKETAQVIVYILSSVEGGSEEVRNGRE